MSILFDGFFFLLIAISWARGERSRVRFVSAMAKLLGMKERERETSGLYRKLDRQRGEGQGKDIIVVDVPVLLIIGSGWLLFSAAAQCVCVWVKYCVDGKRGSTATNQRH